MASYRDKRLNEEVSSVSSYNDLNDKPTIPTALSSLSDDSTHRLVTDTEKSTWNGKQDSLPTDPNSDKYLKWNNTSNQLEWADAGGSFAGTMDDITNGITYVKTENNYTDAEVSKLSGIEAGAEVNNISDANATDLTDGNATTLHKHSYNNLDDKPTIPTISDTAYDATSWDANADAPSKNAVRDKIETLLPKITTAGIGSTPTASGTVQITHSLGRVPSTIRIYSGSGFTANAAATPTTYSIGIWNSSGNFCLYQGINGTTTIAATTSNVFAIYMITSAGNLISGVIQNVGATTFDIVFTETGTHTRGVYMWEAQ